MEPELSRPLCIDLFAGGGGFTIGFEKSGYRVIGYEWIEKIQENAEINGLDIRQADIFSDDFIERLQKDIDIAGRTPTVIVGGPPCQSFSAGNTKGKGEKDERNGIDHFLDIVDSVRPTHFIMENAPTLKKGKKHSVYFKAVLKNIQGMGYKCKAEVVDMSYFRVPQKRRRTIIFGTLDAQVDTFFSLNNLTATQMPVEDVLTRKEIESVTMLEYLVHPIDSNFNNTSVNSENVMSRIPYDVLDRMRGKNGRIEPKKMRNIDITEPSNTLTITSLMGGSLRRQQNTGARFLLWRESDKLKWTLQDTWTHRDDLVTPQMWSYGNMGFPQLEGETEKEWAARGLTIHEMRRIQTFPDTYKFYKTNKTMPKTRELAETIIGNSVPPNFAYVLASRLLMKKDEEIIKELGPLGSNVNPIDLTYSEKASRLIKRRKIGDFTEIILKLKF